MALTLSLDKGNSPKAPLLQLNLDKGEEFFVELSWDSRHDLDGHALFAFNDGNGAKISTMEEILSCYNHDLEVTGTSERTRRAPDKRSFNTYNKVLFHSGDALDGTNANVDEMITVKTANVTTKHNEIPIFITIHPAASATFAEVKDATIRIKKANGTVIGEYTLTNEFAPFDAVQVGAFTLDPVNGWAYSPIGSGFNGDFNFIISHFS